MISGNKETKEKKETRMGRKNYYLVKVGNRVEGICTSEIVAQYYVRYYAKKYDARRTDENVYLFCTASGLNIITYQPVKALKMPK